MRENSIRKQQILYQQQAKELHGRVDPHKELKDLMSEPDKCSVMRYIFLNRSSDWGSIGTGFAWGLQQAAVAS